MFWCQLLALVVAARLGGYALRLIGQPRVVGELLAGVALGPSLFGEVWPTGWRWLFPDDDRQAGLLLGLAWFGIVLLLMTTGAETDLAAVRRQGRAMVATAIGSLVVPFGAGLALGWWLPAGFVGEDGGRGTFAVFMGIALAISSLPVAARILGDLGLLHRPLGQLVLTVAMTNDVVGWVLLGVLAGVAERGAVSLRELAVAITGTVVVTVGVLGLGGWFLDHVLSVVQHREGGPAASASIVVLFAVGVGAVTHAIGLEVVIGAFLAGIAVGRSRLAAEPIVGHIDVVTSAVFAPLFFAVAGLRVDLREIGGAPCQIPHRHRFRTGLSQICYRPLSRYAGATWEVLARCTVTVTPFMSRPARTSPSACTTISSWLVYPPGSTASRPRRCSPLSVPQRNAA